MVSNFDVDVVCTHQDRILLEFVKALWRDLDLFVLYYLDVKHIIMVAW